MTLGITLNFRLIAVRKERLQEVGGMIPDSLGPGIFIRAQDKISARESGDETNFLLHLRVTAFIVAVQ